MRSVLSVLCKSAVFRRATKMSISRWHPTMRGGDWWDFPTPGRIFDQHFGQGMLQPFTQDPFFGGGGMPYWMRPQSGPVQRGGGVSEVVSDKERFAVNLDVSHFAPQEVTVKTVDGTLVVEGKHEEKLDEHGFVSRHFVRKYALPKDVDPAAVQSTLQPDGTLTIEAPKKPSVESNERKVPISMASKPAVEGAKK